MTGSRWAFVLHSLRFKARELLLGGTHEKRSCHLTRWLFLRCLGLVYLSAFASLWFQIDGLFGSDGVWPMSLIKQAQGTGWERFWSFPSLCWLSDSDWFLHLLCGAGVVCSVLLVAGVFQRVLLFLLWLLYLSLTSGSYNVFFSFQWDIFLLEIGFLSIFLGPWNMWPKPSAEKEPSGTMFWLLRLLLFKLMFLSGSVKLLSQDLVWWDLTALTVHYETQPLPTWIAWYAHQLPVLIHQISCGIMFCIELIVPFFIFGPRRFRIFSFWAFSLLQGVIVLTGNYCFFNLLSALLGLALLDDDAFRWISPICKPFEAIPKKDGETKRILKIWIHAVPIAICLMVVPVTAFQILRPFGVQWFWMPPIAQFSSWISPFRMINSYGLFANMTESRPEIIIQGSNDGATWLDYQFKYKPGKLDQPPGFNIPHQPRLDWQMWFAALGNARQNPWFGNLCVRLLQGKESVIRLLDENPFPDRPPKYIRAMMYNYHFTDSSERRETGNWWKHGEPRVYLAPVTLEK